MMDNREDLISQFTDVTGVESERAQFYLESSAWKLEVALASFYENDEPPPSLAHDDDPPAAAIRQEESAKEDSGGTMMPTKAPSTEAKSSKSRFKSRPKFGTISDFRNKDNNSSSEEEEGQAFYAGGSEHSGQQVLGPGKKNDIVSDMFKSCQEHSISLESRPEGHERPNTFSGTGYKLGQTSSDTEVVSPSGSGQRPTAAAAATTATTTSTATATNTIGVITLRLWRDGFTINDREIRSYSDPQNREFLASIKRGEIPAEIRQEVQGAEVRLDMEDHRHEEYVPPKTKVQAFTGKGHVLGSPSPATVGMTLPTDSADQAANETQARRQLNVDSTLPVTTIQIRLADGSCVKVQFNLTHTVADLRQFIMTMRPRYAMREFSLLTMYPTKELTENKTIGEAGLQNSTVIQRLK